MSNNMIQIMMYVAGGLAILIFIAYFILNKKMSGIDMKQVKQLTQGTKTGFSMQVAYQKLYVIYMKIPIIKRYLLKIRRRLEITNLEDEYLTRDQASRMLTKTMCIVVPLIFVIIILTKGNTLLRSILLIFTFFLLESIMDGMADKIDNKILKQQIEFFSEIRHAYHEYNMVEEAIYQTAQMDELEISRQAEKIYEILISNDPEAELEKYYDIAPNSYLKEFAGISYLTKEFGDREIDGASLYLKNLNNITQEMQMEILKRDKLDYVFQSLSVISIVPILAIEPIKNWAVGQFSFTQSFYSGASGMIAQIAILVITFICYLLTRKLKDNGSVNSNVKQTENPWQAKLYKRLWVKKIIDKFLPKEGTKENRKLKKQLKESASKQKIEWLYINRVTLAVLTCVCSFILFSQIHKIAINYQYEQPTTDYNIMGSLSDSDYKKAMKTTEKHNIFLDMFKGKMNTTLEQIEDAMRKSKEYKEENDEVITSHAKKIYDKLMVVNSQYIKWYEVLLAFVFAVVAYNAPVWILIFQAKMRQLEMENEVMQFHTIILMLMKIERVNVEMILEWLERYSKIFREPISKCVNNYESGAWEALEEMKNDVAYPDLIRIIESLQAAVEKIPIAQAFDELDTERAYYQEKRKESNERLISKKGMIGKAIGFTPMVVLFVGYLIVPLVLIGMTSMSSSMSGISSVK